MEEVLVLSVWSVCGGSVGVVSVEEVLVLSMWSVCGSVDVVSVECVEEVLVLSVWSVCGGNVECVWRKCGVSVGVVSVEEVLVLSM